jgi:hypothetical protein
MQKYFSHPSLVRVDRLVSEHLRIQDKLKSSGMVPLLLKLKEHL